MKAYTRSWLALMVLAVIVVGVIALWPRPARAAGPWYVKPGGSDGNSCLSAGSPCATINGAIGKASWGDAIYVATGVYTASPGNEVVLIDKSLTLSGGWDSGFTTQSGMSTIDGEGARRGDTVNSGVTGTIERFVIQNGYADFGGGIYNQGTLTLNNSTVSDNTSQVNGDGIYNDGILTLNNSTISGNTANPYSGGNGGGIYNSSGTLTLNNSTVSGNSGGGGIYNYSGTLTLNHSTVSGNGTGYSGGGINNGGTLTLSHSTVNNNGAGRGGGINNGGTLTLNNSAVSGNTSQFGGGINNGGTLTLNNSTVSGNTSPFGGGIYSDFGTLTLNNSTVSGNSSYNGGGGIYNGSTLTLNNSTVSGNTGGGISNNSYVGTVTLQNSILAGNTGFSPDCNGNIGSAGYNLIGNTSGCTFTPATGDLTNIDPKLGPLQDNGGSTLTHALLPGSPAVNAGNPGGCMGSAGLLTADQRGLARFGRCDIGAYELQPIGFSTETVSPTTASRGDPLTYTITLTNGGAISLTNILVTDTLPSSLTYIGNSLAATGGAYGYNSGVITWTGSLNAGSVVTVTFGASVNQTQPLGTTLVNSATINGGGEIVTRTATVNLPLAQIFLPLSMRPWPGISGRVTLNGNPAAGISLELRFFNGSSFSTLATTTTNADGRYSFIGVPSLAPGQRYYVLYRNAAGTPGRLWLWGTRDLTSYTAGSDIGIGDFDIADIVLVSPPNGATVALPYTFQWTRRPATPSDTYEFDIYDPTDGDPYAYTVPPLGYVGSFTMNGLPPGFGPGAQYAWEIWVYSPDGGYGISYETRLVTFSNTGQSVSTTSQTLRLEPHDLEDALKRR